MSSLSLPRGDSAPIEQLAWSPGYPGSKGGKGVSEKLISLMPKHRTYVAGFAGHDAIYWRKKRAERTIVIDVDEQVHNWWRERAPDVLALRGDFLSIARDDKYVRRLLKKKDTLLDLDPPYLRETRSDRAMWLYEMDTPEEHTDLLTLAKSLPCMVMISGYWSGLYQDALMYEGSPWRCVHYTVSTRGGPREEYCWMNFPEGLELHDTTYAGWDYRQRERIKKKRKRWVRNLLAMNGEERQAIFEDLQTALTVMRDEQERGEISAPQEVGRTIEEDGTTDIHFSDDTTISIPPPPSTAVAAATTESGGVAGEPELALVSPMGFQSVLPASMFANSGGVVEDSTPGIVTGTPALNQDSFAAGPLMRTVDRSSPETAVEENEPDDDAPRCEGCNCNLDVDPCLCGPAGPRIAGVWTGFNAKNEEGGKHV